MSKTDFHHEIHVAQYWREQLGDYEYIKFDPEVLMRWYEALETRGPAEIRSYLSERESRYPSSVITGIVSTTPHPSREIVELWLKSHDKISYRSVWVAGFAMFILIYYMSTSLAGCMGIRTVPSAMPQLGGAMPAQTGTMPPAPSSLPQQLTPPASTASPPTGSSPSSH